MPVDGRRSNSRGSEVNNERPERSRSNSSLFARLIRRNSSASNKKHDDLTGTSTDAPAGTSQARSTSSRQQSPAKPLSRSSSHSSNTTHQAKAGVALDSPAIESNYAIFSEGTTPGLRKDDVKALFYGAPHFMLEKGKLGRSYPQVFFPWNTDLEICDLQDRRIIKHPSFSFATLHSHLPIPTDASTPITSNKNNAWNRPTFELDIFERPNMLSLDGKEPGTVAMRYFLELPEADSLQTEKKRLAQQDQSLKRNQLAYTQSFEVYKAQQHERKSYTIGRKAPWHDRAKLIHGGPLEWKGIGVRNIEMKYIAKRLAMVSRWHDYVMTEGVKALLEKETCEDLYHQLFTELIYLPEKYAGEADSKSFKIQVESLVQVLTTPGVWIDFSLEESRFRLCQVLWEVPSRGSKDKSTSIDPLIDAERKWFLVQMLLSIELNLRLDAVIRLGVVHQSDVIPHVSAHEVHHFMKLRSDEVDWNLVLARRCLDHAYFEESGKLKPTESSVHEINLPHKGLPLRLKHEKDPHDKTADISSWDYLVVLPRQPRLQLDGLLCFARRINWPNFAEFEELITRKLHQRSEDPAVQPMRIYATPILDPTCSPRHAQSGDFHDVSNTTLQAANSFDSTGGWLSRAWLTGLILPGKSISHFLISTLIENDANASSKLCGLASLCGGFILDGRTWWSKDCIVGRVTAPYTGGTECIGWVSTPEVLPVTQEGKPFQDGWLDVGVEELPTLRSNTRLHDGVKLAEESSPLGMGHGKVMESEFLMPFDQALDALPRSEVSFTRLILQGRNQAAGKVLGQSTSKKTNASAVFTIQGKGAEASLNTTFQLVYDTYFVTAAPCRLPHGHIMHGADIHVGQHPHHEIGEVLPSHPLHNTFKYTLKAITDLGSAVPSNRTSEGNEVWVVDARGSCSRDMLVRAWCSQVGSHALVARVGRTCFSCAVREAKAIDVGIIIRVG